MPLVTRTHIKDDAQSSAVYSGCDFYRYALTREWTPDLPRLHYVMLNPSKATEVHNDPTIERCERRARALGFGAFRVTNLFAWRETDPAKLRKAKNPIGSENDTVIADAATWADQTLAAWGVHGTHLDRAAQVEALLRKSESTLLTLGLTKEGHPRHPLYVAYRQQPLPWVADI